MFSDSLPRCPGFPFWFSQLATRRRRRRKRAGWNKHWSRDDFDRPWLGRGVSREVITAVREGWFPARGKAIDLGCGEGEIAAWLASQGYEAIGVDIAPAAVQRAQGKYAVASGQLLFTAHDLCIRPPPGGPYSILVDRGCYHQISDRDLMIYGHHLSEASTADARLLLLHKAFRNGIPLGDQAESQRVLDRVLRGLGPHFVVERREPTFMDAFQGENPERALPGLVFWMRKRGE